MPAKTKAEPKKQEEKAKPEPKPSPGRDAMNAKRAAKEAELKEKRKYARPSKPKLMFWEKEKPKIAESENTRLSRYKKSGKLVISSLYKAKNGTIGIKRNVVIDIEDIVLFPAIEKMLLSFIKEARDARE